MSSKKTPIRTPMSQGATKAGLQAEGQKKPFNLKSLAFKKKRSSEVGINKYMKSFKANTTIEHKILGRGYMVNCIHGRLEVLFKEGLKLFLKQSLKQFMKQLKLDYKNQMIKEYY